MRKSVNVSKKNRIIVDGWSRNAPFIVIEGNDGAGKSTAVKYLSKYLASINKTNVIMKFNMSKILVSSIKFGKSIFFGPYTNTLMHMTSIIDQMERFILDSIQNGKTIICDRYVYSLIARGLARGVKETLLTSLLDWLPVPDIVFYFDISPMLAIERIGLRNLTFWECGQDCIFDVDKKESFLKFQGKVRDVFIQNEKLWNFTIIDATSSPKDILCAINKVLEEKNII